jgi:hypothetical protein
MQRSRALENNGQSAPDRGAESYPPPSKPLTQVADAVAGGDLESVATTVARALDCPIAIAIPALGDPVVHPAGSLTGDAMRAIAAHAAAIGRGEEVPAPEQIADAVAVQIGDQIVGIVAAARSSDNRAAAGPSPTGSLPPDAAAERRAWLQAAAAAASVTALIRETHTGGARGSCEALLAELAAGPPEDLPAFLVRARRLGLELGSGATAISARRPATGNGHPVELAPDDRRLIDELQNSRGVLIAELRAGRVLAVTPSAAADGSDQAAELAAGLRDHGLAVAVSAPRRDPSQLHDAVREADLLAELGGDTDPAAPGQDETYRLLIGVLLRDHAELARLRDRTITPLADYDTRHDTELLATLRTFLVHDGSTTETAEAMSLHRHTVGYRLSRVHEVSGLSPYESDGRERLSLGIKADHILEAERRLGLVSTAP